MVIGHFDDYDALRELERENRRLTLKVWVGGLLATVLTGFTIALIVYV